MDDELIARAEVRASGGVVVRAAEAGPEVAVVHRPGHDDWSLPKGKLAAGEGWQDAARREVQEETGLRCTLEEELEPASYRVRGDRLKVVRYWRMTPLGGDFQVSKEVDELRWLAPGEAAELLTYEHDRALVNGLGA